MNDSEKTGEQLFGKLRFIREPVAADALMPSLINVRWIQASSFFSRLFHQPFWCKK